MPDPILTANLYAAGCLDAVIAKTVVPLRQALDRLDPRYRLWMMRYRGGGEHLKLRLHGPVSDLSRLRRLVAQAAQTGLQALAPVVRQDASAHPAQTAPAPPVDPEDAVEHPDRSWTWTTWQRHPLSLGNRMMLDDEVWVGAILDTLMAGCDRVLDAFDPGTTELTVARRRSVLLHALLDGFAALEQDAGQRLTYLAYHRDWLLRASLVTGRIKAENERDAARLLERKMNVSADVVDSLAELAAQSWSAVADSAPWERALRGLRDALAPRREDPDCQPDPFTGDLLFPALFKAFHGLANQLGCSPPEEAAVYQLLATAAAQLARQEDDQG